MYERHQSGLEPTHFSVVSDTSIYWVHKVLGKAL
jgi:hypothetical protein